MKEKFEKERKDNQNHIEDPMTDMPDMEDDEKFRQWLEETYINEAEIIEKSLLAGQEYEKNPEKAEELRVPREKFYQRLKEEGLYEEASAENENAETSRDDEVEKDTASEDSSRKIIFMEPGKTENSGTASATEKSHPVRKKRSYLRLGKVAGVAGVCLLCVFAASMTSEANRNHFIEGIRYLAGDDTRVIIDNDKNNEFSNEDEYKALEDIEESMGITMPEFYYRPNGLQFLNYEISNKTSIAKIEYQYNNTIIMFYIDKQNDDTASNINMVSGTEKLEDTVLVDGITVTIKKILDENEEMSTYIAGWNKNGVSFSLIGKIEIEELKKIVKYMKF